MNPQTPEVHGARLFAADRRARGHVTLGSSTCARVNPLAGMRVKGKTTLGCVFFGGTSFRDAFKRNPKGNPHFEVFFYFETNPFALQISDPNEQNVRLSSREDPTGGCLRLSLNAKQKQDYI